jgi:hypothetical protein
MDQSKFFQKHAGTFKEILLLLGLATLIFLVYSSNLSGPFIFDDSRIENNPQLHITQLSLKNLARAGFESSPSTRPVSYITFALNHYFHGFDPQGYHLVNIAIHILAAIFLYLLIKTTLNLPLLRSRFEAYPWLPFAAALIWATHPLQTQSVTYIIQRMNSLAAMFYILSLYLYVKGRLVDGISKKSVLFLCSLFVGLLSLGSKEIAFTLPFFILLYEWYFLQDLDTVWLKRRVIPASIIFIFLAVLVFLYLGAGPIDIISKSYGARDFTMIQRVLTESRVVIFYISLLLFPHPARLNLDHHFIVSNSLFDPLTTLLSLGCLAILFGLAAVYARKYRLISFCIIWFLGNLLIESSLIGLEIIFEHRNYLPSMMAVLLIILPVFHFINRPSWLPIVILCLIVILLSSWTYTRNRIWSDRISLWSDCAAKSPLKARPHNNLGVALKKSGKLTAAVEHFNTTIRLDPEFTEAYNNLGNTYILLGKYDEGIRNYLAALQISPQNAKVHTNLGNAYAKRWELEKAIYHYSEALRKKPYDQELQLNLLSVQRMLDARRSRGLKEKGER